MEEIKTLQVSKNPVMMSDEEVIKSIETQIIMHCQTKKQVRTKNKNPKTVEKIIAQIDKAIEENIEKIKVIKPDYKCPYNEDNVEDEIHSPYDPKAKGHVEDTLGLQSVYSGEKNYIPKTDKERTEAAKKFLKELDEQQKGENQTISSLNQATEDIFNRLNNIPQPNRVDIDAVAEEIHNDNSLNNDQIKKDYSVEYDLVPLPSNGECYKHKKKRLSVAYLTAFDENMITSPNLYENDRITEYLLKNKILDKDVDVMGLTKGDSDAILVWLRKTGYGSDYPVTITDKDSGKPFDTVINLDDIKMNEFKLKADENGYFDFECPQSKAKIKFRFITLADMKALNDSLKIETEDVRKNYVASLSARIKNLINIDRQLTSANRKVLCDSLEIVDKWTTTKSQENFNFSYSITDILERMIVSINGNDDRAYIKKFIQKMPALDSLKFRKYVDENEPSMNFVVEVERPDDLGGGRIQTFLNWDKYVFTNTPVV